MVGRVAGHDVDDAGREAGALGELGEGEGGERGLGARVDHHGAAGGECCGGLAGDHRGGEVPRRDQRRDAGRLAPELDLGVLQVRGDALDVRAVGLLGVELDEGGGVVDLAAGFGEGLALLAGHDAGEILAGGEDQRVPAAEDGAALLRQQGGPGGEGRLRGVGGGAGLGGGEGGDVADGVAGGGVGDGEGRARLAGGPAAGDVGEAAQQAGVGEGGGVEREGHGGVSGRLPDECGRFWQEGRLKSGGMADGSSAARRVRQADRREARRRAGRQGI